MRIFHIFVCFLILCQALLACGGGPDPLKEGPTTALTLPQPLPEVSRRLSVVVLLDERHRRVPGYEQRMSARIAALSDQLQARTGVALRLKAVEPWPEMPDTAIMESLLSDLEALDHHRGVAPEADLVFALTARPPPPGRSRMQQLVASRYAGRFVVTRSLTRAFDRKSPASRAQAELLVLLHGLGRIFGALPACGDFVMGRTPPIGWASPDRRPLQWHPTNLRQMRAHAGLAFASGQPVGQISQELARAALEQLSQPMPSEVARCDEPELRRRRLLLDGLSQDKPPEPEVPEPVAEPPPPDVAPGLAALEEGRPGEALAVCAPVAEIRPQGEAARCAGLAAEALGRPEEAMRFLRAHLAHHPGDGQVVLHLARLIGRSGDDGAARALLEGFVGRNPDNAPARINLGIAYARLGDFDRARAQWEAVLSQDPENADARELLSQLPQ